jgi:hypothetical protein
MVLSLARLKIVCDAFSPAVVERLVDSLMGVSLSLRPACSCAPICGRRSACAWSALYWVDSASAFAAS